MKKRTKRPNGKKKRKTRDPNGNLLPGIPGNAWWKMRSSHGRKPKFASPEELEAACNEYFEFMLENPFYELKLGGSYKGVPVTTELPRMKPFTIGTLCIFLDIELTTWHGYKERSDDFHKVCMQAERTIREQKFAGAASGFFNHAIIARDLGLVDRSDMTSGNKPIENKTVVVLPAKEE